VNYHKLLFAFIVGAFSLSCTNTYSIEEQKTAEILKSLSSDEMRGRYALSDEIHIAEQFIASEFQSAGLLPFNELDTYEQSFYVSESKLESADISVAGKKILDSDFIAFTVDEQFTGDNESISLGFINQNDNFRSKFNDFRKSDVDVLVFVDMAFEELFGRYGSYYRHEHRFIEDSKKANVLFVLSENFNENFAVNITSKLERKQLTNLVGMVEGNRKNEFVIFSAHHDHLGIRTPINADSIANGANDNASGVTAVIQLAHHFASQPKPERNLLFVTFTAEELGGYGSQYFSSQLNPNEIVAMFNIEMVGKPALSGPNTAWITGYNRSTFGEILSKSTEGTIYEFYADPYPKQNLFYRSDNATLARLGVPAHSISTTPIDIDTDYHQVTDEFETINISHLNNTIKAIAKAAEGIISGKYTPTRLDPSQLD